jgi:7-keto-8-aminopelargonate synthetase-like enzyme
MALAAALQASGFDIRGIRPPTVPAGTARLRISLTNNVDRRDVRAMLDALEETAGEGR